MSPSPSPKHLLPDTFDIFIFNIGADSEVGRNVSSSNAIKRNSSHLAHKIKYVHIGGVGGGVSAAADTLVMK